MQTRKIEYIEKMFQNFGLETNEDRQRFLDINPNYIYDKSQEQESVVIRLGNSSSDLCFKDEVTNAKLESDS